MWREITSVPFGHAVEVLAEDEHGAYKLPFLVRQMDGTWMNATTGEPLTVRPKSWRKPTAVSGAAILAAAATAPAGRRVTNNYPMALGCPRCLNRGFKPIDPMKDGTKVMRCHKCSHTWPDHQGKYIRHADVRAEIRAWRSEK
jgi:hypothetical protein